MLDGATTTKEQDEHLEQHSPMLRAYNLQIALEAFEATQIRWALLDRNELDAALLEGRQFHWGHDNPNDLDAAGAAQGPRRR